MSFNFGRHLHPEHVVILLHSFCLRVVVLSRHAINISLSAAVCFQKIWWINKFGGKTEYAPFIVVCIGTGNTYVFVR